jgi:2-methylcitrate dehydratase PrpD
MDASIILAEYVARTGYNDLPSEAVEASKRDILDTIGVAIAGSSVSGGKEIMALVREWGGKEESTVVMFGERVPAPFAALVNATMAHALDFDDAHERVILHAGVTTIPAALAAAERAGRVTGKQFINAVTLGIDLICRLGEASNKHPAELGFMYTSLYGIFGAAVAAGKILGLSKEQLVNAIGIAYSQASGNFQCVADGALTKRMQAGFAASAGITAALLAGQGLTGAKNSFQGEKGLFKIYLRDEYSPDRLTADMGKHFGVVDLSFKPYPCCRNCHPFIDATLALTTEHNINPSDVDRIFVRCGEGARMLCEPQQIRQNPRVFIDAQFSIPWVIATALVKGKVTLDDFTPQSILNRKVLEIAAKVATEVDPEMDARGTSPAFVEIKMKGSDLVYSRRDDIAKGNPAKPMSWNELCDKFIDCAAHGIKPMSANKVQKVIDLISNLEEIEDIRLLTKLLV